MDRRITGIYIRNYRGIEELDANIAPAGVVARGENGEGKTSFLKAVQAALAGRGIDAGAIRHGSDRAEILVNMDDVSVSRTITQDRTKLVVKQGETKIGSPQKWLSELVGPLLDPMSLYLATPRERKALVLDVLPVKLSADHIARWIPEAYSKLLPPARIADMLEKHGLEACTELHKFFYEHRAAANSDVRALESKMELQRELVRDLASKTKPSTPTVDIAQNHRDAAVAHVSKLEQEQKLAAEQRGRFASLQEKIDAMLSAASMSAPTQEACDSAAAAVDAAAANVARVEEQIESLERGLREAKASLVTAKSIASEAKSLRDHLHEKRLRASQERETASAWQATITDHVMQEPTDEEIAEAKAKVIAAEAVLADAKALAFFNDEKAKLEKMRKDLQGSESEASALTRIVDLLRIEAPTQLLSECKGIPGLGIDGDDVTLDGKTLDSLCGAEQLRFAIEIARRANASSKILIVDKLEALDPAHYDLFLREATRDGYQLLATRVDSGGMYLERIEPKDEVLA